jgi:signal transduction histidine kinase
LSDGVKTGVVRALAAYSWRHAKITVLLALCCGIFAAVLALYDLPVEAVGYAALLCACLCALFFLVGFAQFRARCRLLDDLRRRVALSIDDLPTPRDAVERRYSELVAAVHRDKTAALTAIDRRQAEALEVYTLWAHQIKTPIAAMRVLLTPDQRELRMELAKVEQYVDMVLQVLRLGSSSDDLRIERVDLDTVVRQTVRKLSPIFIHKRIALAYEPLERQVLTDEKWLSFVIEQVLSNALKYTRAGGSVTIAMQEGASCTLFIADTGIGIRKEDLPRVFEKGYTGYNGRVDKQATGIGLYLCKRVMDKLSHGIAIESSVGEGTRVFMNLDSANLHHE